MGKSQGRIIMRIEIQQKAADSFIGSAQKLGMTKVATTSRIVEWLVAQDGEVIAAILGTHPAPPSSHELARMIAETIK